MAEYYEGVELPIYENSDLPIYENVELPIKICGIWNEYVVLKDSYGILPETIRTLKSKLTGETDPEILDEMTPEFMEYKVIKNGCLNWKDFKQVKQMQETGVLEVKK